MKKILSLILVLAMVMSMGITTAFAAGNWEGGTQVTYTATGAEEWTVTVPAELAPGGSGDVTASGTWGSNRKLTVTADANVTLTNSINAADQKTLVVTFPGIELVGSNTAAVADTKAVSVADISDALFGTWSGKFNYNVEMVTGADIQTFTVVKLSDYGDIELQESYQFEVGMSYLDWVNSEYNPNPEKTRWDSDFGNIWFILGNDWWGVLNHDEYYGQRVDKDDILEAKIYYWSI